MDIVIIGVGQFGSALSQTYAKQGRRVFQIKNAHSQLALTADQASHALFILCVPTQSIPDVVAQRSDFLSRAVGLVSTAKGLIRKSGETPLQYLGRNLKRQKNLFVLSGPSFASEVAQGMPTALVLAGQKQNGVDRFCTFLSTPRLRLYKSLDPFGVELCGALKNVYAIAAGLCEGLGFGDNTRAALMTRALAEMTRIGRALKADPMTFFGLAGVGDLFLTCSSRQSRNYRYGLGLAQGRSSEELLKEIGTVEGLWTASVAQKLCTRRNLRAPLIKKINAIIEGRLAPHHALEELMTRKLRHEFE